MTAATASGLRNSAWAARRHGHEVAHAYQRHDPFQLPFVVAGSMQPHDERIGVSGFIVQRSEHGQWGRAVDGAKLRGLDLSQETGVFRRFGFAR